MEGMSGHCIKSSSKGRQGSFCGVSSAVRVGLHTGQVQRFSTSDALALLARPLGYRVHDHPVEPFGLVHGHLEENIVDLVHGIERRKQ
jgi:hypothetical protein